MIEVTLADQSKSGRDTISARGDSSQASADFSGLGSGLAKSRSASAPAESVAKEYCSTKEAAHRLGLSLGTVQQMVESGVLEGWKTAGGGSSGLASMLDIWRRELANTMALTGVTRIDQINRDLLEV